MAKPSNPAPLARDAMAYVLAGGRGTRLMELTDRRAKPAVYFGGKSRIIDFALSNAINSGIRRISVATQYQAHSLIRHLQRGWNFLRTERNESFDILPASQRVAEDLWYAGTADAVYQNMDIIEDQGAKYIVVLAGDHVYKMDYEIMLRQHVDTGADVTVGCLEVPRMEATAFGVMHVDGRDRIIDFVEKPKDPPGIPDRPDLALASMGIYVFETKFLMEQLKRDAATEGSSRDFGKDIIPYIVKNGSAWAHRFTQSCVRSEKEDVAYWRDVGTIDLDACGNHPAGQVRARPRRPARTRYFLADLGRLHRFGRTAQAHASGDRCAGQFLFRAQRSRGPAALHDRPWRAPQQGGRRCAGGNP
jgi:glucose-1-phosphate adenylyltransferase